MMQIGHFLLRQVSRVLEYLYPTRCGANNGEAINTWAVRIRPKKENELKHVKEHRTLQRYRGRSIVHNAKMK